MQELAKNELLYKVAAQNPTAAIVVIAAAIIIGAALGVAANIKR